MAWNDELPTAEDRAYEASKKGWDAEPPTELERQYNTSKGIENKPTVSEALAGHGLDAAAIGYGPHVKAMAEPITSRIRNLLTGAGVKEPSMSQMTDFGPEYLKARDENIAQLKLQQKTHPWASKIGTGLGISGGTMLNPIGRQAAVVGKGLSGLGKLAMKGLGYGAVGGFSMNPGDAPGVLDPTQFDKRFENAQTGGEIGFFMNPALTALGNKLYGSGSKKILQSTEQAGKDPAAVQELLMNKQIYGSERSVKNQIEAEKQAIGKTLDPYLKAADDANHPFSMKNAMVPASETAAILKGRDLLSEKPYVAALKEHIDFNLAKHNTTPGSPAVAAIPDIPAVTKDVRGPLDAGGWPTRKIIITKPGVKGSPGIAAGPDIPAPPLSNVDIGRPFKTSMNDMQNAASWNPDVATPLMSRNVWGPQAEGARIELENNVRKALGEEAAKAYIKANAEYGMLAGTQKGAAAAAKLGDNNPLLSKMQNFLLHNPKAIGIKKAADFLMSPASMTGLGSHLTQLGTSPQLINESVNDEEAAGKYVRKINPWRDR